MKRKALTLVLFLCLIIGTLTGCDDYSSYESNYTEEGKTLNEYVAEESEGENNFSGTTSINTQSYLASIPYEEDTPATILNNNKPCFTEEELEFAKNMASSSAVLDNEKAYSEFSDLDGLGRVGMAYGILNKATMPDDDVMREDISSVTPTGWKQGRYSWIDNGGWLYNRCHLIAWSLTGENDNEKNLMTGTRSFNVDGMLPYEVKVLKYLNSYPENHVLYRATPVFSGSEMLARGILLEAWSIEDDGYLSFCAYIHNVEPGVDIDYQTGKNKMNEYVKILKEGDNNEK